MKKYFSLFALTFVAGLMIGCSGGQNKQSSSSNESSESTTSSSEEEPPAPDWSADMKQFMMDEFTYVMPYAPFDESKIKIEYDFGFYLNPSDGSIGVDFQQKESGNILYNYGDALVADGFAYDSVHQYYTKTVESGYELEVYIDFTGNIEDAESTGDTSLDVYYYPIEDPVGANEWLPGVKKAMNYYLGLELPYAAFDIENSRMEFDIVHDFPCFSIIDEENENDIVSDYAGKLTAAGFIYDTIDYEYKNESIYCAYLDGPVQVGVVFEHCPATETSVATNTINAFIYAE